MTTPILSISELAVSQASKYITVNSALRRLEALTIRVLDIRTSAPPGSPANGDAYICGSGSISGDWSTYTINDIAYYNEGWYNLTPAEGMRVWVNDEDFLYVYDSAAWSELAAPGPIIKRLAAVTADMQNGDSATTLYTVPAGKKCIPTTVVVRNPSGSLAGGTDYDVGDTDSPPGQWMTTIDLSGVTAVTDVIVLTNNNAKFTVYDAGDVLTLTVNTGATADVTATVEVFGYIYDA